MARRGSVLVVTVSLLSPACKFEWMAPASLEIQQVDGGGSCPAGQAAGGNAAAGIFNASDHEKNGPKQTQPH